MAQETRQQHEEKVAKYIAEHRPVSGGKDNPPDRYEGVQLTGNLVNDVAAINALADQGYRFVSTIPFYNYVLMGNYKENK